MTTVVFITVHYRNSADVRRLVENVRALRMPPGWRAAIVIVDNSGDAEPLPGVVLVRAPSNLGYLAGAAFGLERWVDENGAVPEWVAVVNSDVEFHADALEALAAADPGPEIVAVAPAVMLRGEIAQNPFFRTRPSRLRMWLYTVIFRSALFSKVLDVLLAAKRRGTRSSGTPETIYAAHGSVIVLRLNFFARGGSLRYRGFMYGEEIHVAEQVRAGGGSILYLPAMRATHRGSSTTGGVTSRQRRLWHLQSARVLWNDYFHPMDARIAELVKRAATLLGLDATTHEGRVLPARYLRLCGSEFRDDAYFLASARREADRLVARHGLTAAGAVLDVGCGFGRLAIGLADRLPALRRYEGIDVSVAAVRWCRRHVGRKHPNFRFTHLDLQNARYNPAGRSMADGFRLPFGDGDFDVAYLYSVFSHMEWPDVRAYLSELHRTVRAGGSVFLTMYAAVGGADVTVNPADSDREWTGPLHCVRYRRDFIEGHFGEAGFDVEDVSHGTETDGQSGYVLRRR